jgi:hypothetical protein
MYPIDELFQPLPAAHGNLLDQLLLSLLTAFVIGQLSAWCYKWSHRGLSYSRSFTQALVLISIVSAISMSLVSSRPIIAIGLLGGMAIIRFRTVVRDARDTAYVFLCLICGMATGFGFYGTALLGAVAANLVALYLHAMGFGAWHSSDSLLRFQVAGPDFDSTALAALFRRFCRRCSVLSVDESPAPHPDGEPTYLYCYKVRLRDPEQGPDLVSELKRAFRTEAIHLLAEQEYEEVD